MSPRKIISRHARMNLGLLCVIFRALTYSFILALAFWFSRTILSNTYHELIALFVLLSITFELLWYKPKSGPRMWAYCVVVLCLLFSGIFLVKESAALHTEQFIQNIPTVQEKR